MAIERKNLCPNCGAILTGLELKCPECGYTLTAETTGSKNVTDSLLDLQEKLLAVDKVFNTGSSSSKKKASIINAFPIPNTAESLVRLLHMSYSNFEAAKEAGDNKLSVAWLGKAIESYRRLSEMQGGLNIGDTLEKYKALGDKKAFSKLSGSRTKKRRNTIIGFAAIAAIVTFVLLFDWAGWLMRSGKTDQAVRFLKATGRVNQAAEMLVEGGMVEDAAELLFSDGQMVNAVSLLAQKGLIKEALIMTGRTNSADSIHTCVDELSRFAIITGREIFYLDDNTIILKELKTKVYDHDRWRWEVQLNQNDTLWWDAWRIFDTDYHIYPESHIFNYSPFAAEYRGLSYSQLKQIPNPEIIEAAPHMLAGIQFKHYDKKIYFHYRGINVIEGETVIYKGTPTLKVNYMYGVDGNLLKTVKYTFLLSQEEIDKKYSKNEAPLSNKQSYTDHYNYKDGNLIEITRTRDYYDDFLTMRMIFDNFENISVSTRSDLNYDSERMETSDSNVVEIFANGQVVEQFSIQF